MFIFVLGCLKPGTSLSDVFFNSPLPGNVIINAFQESIVVFNNLSLEQCQDMCINFSVENPCKAVTYGVIMVVSFCNLFLTSPLTDLGVPTSTITSTAIKTYIRKCL